MDWWSTPRSALTAEEVESTPLEARVAAARASNGFTTGDDGHVRGPGLIEMRIRIDLSELRTALAEMVTAVGEVGSASSPPPG